MGEPTETFMESLKILNPNYQPSGNEAEVYIWQTKQDLSFSPEELAELGISNNAILEKVKSMKDDVVIETLKREWNDEPVRSGVALKILPSIFSPGVCKVIESEWEALPMASRDRLIEIAELRDGGKTFLEMMVTKGIIIPSPPEEVAEEVVVAIPMSQEETPEPAEAPAEPPKMLPDNSYEIWLDQKRREKSRQTKANTDFNF